MPTPSTYRFVAVENIATSQPPHFASARSATPSSFRRLRFLTASRFPHDLEMKPATLNDPEEGQPLLADPPTSRRTPKILAAAVVALGLLGAAAVASSQVAPSSPVQAFDTAPLCDSTVETSVVNYTIPGLVNVFNAESPSSRSATRPASAATPTRDSGPRCSPG